MLQSLYRRHFGLNFYLSALTLAALLPVLVVSGVAVWEAGNAYRETATRRLSDTSRTLASAIEADLEGRFTILSVLASLGQALDHPGGARLTKTRFEGVGVDGEIEIIPQGDVVQAPIHPDSTRAVARRAIDGQSPAVSNLALGQRREDYRLSLALPVDAADGEKRAIVLSVKPEQLIRSLQQPNTALSDILVAVTDGNGRIIARSRNQHRSIGVKAPDWEKLIALRTDHGWFEAVTMEGQPVILSFRMLRGTPGWTIVVGEQMDVFNARWRNPLVGLAIGAFLAFVLATGVALWIGRMILRPVAALASRSEGIADGAALTVLEPIPSSPVREFEMLRLNVVAAERVQKEEERRLSVVAQAGALVLWRWRVEDGLVWVKGWQELTGTPESEALGTAWMSRVHPEDRGRIIVNFTDTVERKGTIDIEFRLRVGDDQWMWVRDRGAPVIDDDGSVIEWAGVLEDIDVRKQSEARIAYLAHHDALTALGNRVLLRERLGHAVKRIRFGVNSALLSLDLDRFKQVNDTLGHPVGDALLRAVADRLRSCIRENDFVARIGGDEFAIIQQDAQPEAAAALAGRLVKTIGAPYEVDGHSISIGTSIGIVFISETGFEIDNYLKWADKALYRAKERGRGQACFYEAEKAYLSQRKPARLGAYAGGIDKAG